jgi:hypothetical protein
MFGVFFPVLSVASKCYNTLQIFCSSASAAQMLDAMEDVVCRLWHQISKISLLRIMRGFFCSDLFQSLKNITRIPTMFCFSAPAAEMSQISRLQLNVVLWSIARPKWQSNDLMPSGICSALFQSLQKSTP